MHSKIYKLQAQPKWLSTRSSESVWLLHLLGVAINCIPLPPRARALNRYNKCMRPYNSELNGAIELKYPSPTDPILEDLRRASQIEFKDDTSDIEKAKVIIAYVHNLFDHDGDNEPSKLDPLTILTEAKRGSSFRCVEYSLLAVGLLWAHDIAARKIGLKTADVETSEYGAGHVVTEFWSRNLGKWIMSDVQWGIIPKSQDGYMSALELKQTIEEGRELMLESVNGTNLTHEQASKYVEWVKDYLYFLDTPIEPTFQNMDLKSQKIAMLVPKSVKPPVKFQNTFEMNAVYTNNPADFYPEYRY